jgi:hypothetical protein
MEKKELEEEKKYSLLKKFFTKFLLLLKYFFFCKKSFLKKGKNVNEKSKLGHCLQKNGFIKEKDVTLNIKN